MARLESDREDLLAEATALVVRAEWTCPGFPEPVVAGLRRDGGLSVYFGGDPACHFDPAGRLKRAYSNGRLYRTQGNTLAELTRERTPAATVLHRRDLSAEECDAFSAAMRRRLGQLSADIESGAATLLRQVPTDDPRSLARLASALGLAAQAGGLAPRFKGKR